MYNNTDVVIKADEIIIRRGAKITIVDDNGDVVTVIDSSSNFESYDNTDSDLVATTIKGAIDELNTEKIDESYDNTDSDLVATTIQGAIDELDAEKIDGSYDNSTSGLTATTIQGAIDELKSLIVI